MPTALTVALALVITLLAVLVVGLLRSHAEILRALHDLGVNLEDGAPAAGATSPRPRAGASLAPAVDVGGALPGGGSAHVAVAGADHPTLLAFLSSGCGTCGVFWEELANPEERRRSGESTHVVIVTQGPEHESPAQILELAPAGVVTVMSSQAWDDYGVPVSPYFVLVDGPTSRVVGEGAGGSWSQVVGLLARSATDASSRTAGRPSRRSRNGSERAADIDQALRAAGIEPGDPSLHPPSHDDRPMS